MLSKSLKRIHPIFIIVFCAWVLTSIIMFLDPRIFSPFHYLDWEPGLAFSLAVGLAMKKLWKVTVFVILSVPVYYVVVRVFMDSVYAGPGPLVVNTVFIIGATLELLSFSVIYGFIKRLRWWHFLLAALAGVLSIVVMDLTLYVAFAVWYGIMAFTFYTLIRARGSANV